MCVCVGGQIWPLTFSVVSSRKVRAIFDRNAEQGITLNHVISLVSIGGSADRGRRAQIVTLIIY